MIEFLLTLDANLLRAARQLVSADHALFIQICSELIVVWGIFILVGLWLIGTIRKDTELKRQSLRIFFTIVLVFALYGVINLGIPQWRPAPDEVVSGVKPLIPHPIGNSFPSGHALFSIALFVGIWQYVKLCRGTLLTLTVLLAIVTTGARVIGGVHYPGDILGGLIIGGVIALFGAKYITGNFMETKVYPWFLRLASFFRL